MTRNLRAAPKSIIPSVVRKSAVWAKLQEVLREFDVSANVGRGAKHWYLEVQIGHTPRKHFFSPTMGDARSADNSAAQLRRIILTTRTSIGGVL